MPPIAVATTRRLLLAQALLLAAWHQTYAGGWSVTPINSASIDTALVPATGLSGLTATVTLGGAQQFVAVEDSGGALVTISATLAADGSIVSAATIANVALPGSLDNEGVTLADNGLTAFVSDELFPSVREFSLATGAELLNLPIEPVFASHTRPNLGFEAIARSGDDLWVANEEALTVDGPESTLAPPETVVRIQRYDISGFPSFDGQFAYEVDPIHFGDTTDDPAASGLVELATMPDGSLVALERSLGILGGILPEYESRLYALDFSGATDVSGLAGLVGQSFTPVDKELLWSGQAGGGLGQNLEGITLGPQLADGDWTLIGVVDDGGAGDPLSSNTLVSFRLSPVIAPGDYNLDWEVDGDDFLVWRDEFGATGPNDADGNGDEVVDAADYVFWRDVLPQPGPLVEAVALPEPTSGLLWLVASGLGAIARRP